MSFRSLPDLEAPSVACAIEDFLASVGDVFVVHRGHDSGITSYGSTRFMAEEFERGATIARAAL